jgi:hypothetical protein
MGGLQSLVHDVGQVIPDRVQVNGVFQADGERDRRHGHGAASTKATSPA